MHAGGERTGSIVRFVKYSIGLLNYFFGPVASIRDGSFIWLRVLMVYPCWRSFGPWSRLYLVPHIGHPYGHGWLWRQRRFEEIRERYGFWLDRRAERSRTDRAHAQKPQSTAPQEERP